MINDNFYEYLGTNIKSRRKALGLSQQALADRVNLSLNFIGKIEVAFSKPSLETVIAIANALDVTVSELCCFKNI